MLLILICIFLKANELAVIAGVQVGIVILEPKLNKPDLLETHFSLDAFREKVESRLIGAFAIEKLPQGEDAGEGEEADDTNDSVVAEKQKVHEKQAIFPGQQELLKEFNDFWKAKTAKSKHASRVIVSSSSSESEITKSPSPMKLKPATRTRKTSKSTTNSKSKKKSNLTTLANKSNQKARNARASSSAHA
jgi:hypothetical protein